MSAAALSLHAQNITSPGVQDVTFSVAPGEHVALIGPNGAGKTTCLRLLAGLKRPLTGQILCGDKDMTSLVPREIARQVAYLSQADETDPDFIVEDYLKLGCLPFTRTPDADARIMNDAASRCGVTSLRSRRIGALSGGERQRVMLARCLVQTPGILLLDEPTNHLDLAARSELLALLRDLPITIVAVLHDLALLADFADRVVVMKSGRIIDTGTPDAIFSGAAVASAFRVTVHPVTLGDGTCSHVFRAIK